MKKQPLLILLMCFVTGIVFQDKLTMSPPAIYFLLGISAISLFLISIKTAFFQQIKHYLLGLFFFCIGLYVHFFSSDLPTIPSLDAKENIVFQLSKKLNSNEKNRRYVVEVLAIPSKELKDYSPVKTVLSIPKDQDLLDFNHFYDAEVYIHQPESIHNNFQFDYKKYLARQKIYLQAYLPNEILKTDKTGVTFPDRIRQARLTILNKINQSPLSPKIQEFLKGIILSDRTEMDAETVRDFNQTGLVHLLAISGSHMVIIFWIALFLFNTVIPVKFRNVAVVLSLVLIWSFAVFIDYGSSVMRSCLMITCYYIMILLQRRPDLLHSMALSAFIILMADSQQLFDVGFQLSYVAVLGIWWLAVPFKRLFRRPRSRAEKFIYEITAMTFAAQIATLPLTIYYFHQFSPVSIFANLLIIPLSEVIIISSLLMVIAIAFGMKQILAYQLFDTFILSVLKVIHWFSGFDAMLNRNIALTILEMAALFCAIYVLRFLIRDVFNLKYLLRFGACLLLFFGFRLGFNYNSYRNGEVLVHSFYKDKIVSVKDRDRAVFWLKDDENKDKVTDFVINPYLISRRIKDYQINYYPGDAQGFVYQAKAYDLK